MQGPFWIKETEAREHQVCGRHGAILFRYPPEMAAAAMEHVKRLQSGYDTEVRNALVANALSRIAVITDISESDPKELERLLRRVRDLADEALK